MKKLIFGAVAALVISGSVFANETTKESTEVDVKQIQTYCRVTVTTTHANGSQTSSTTYYPVSSGEAGVKQCNAIKQKTIASLSVD